MCADQEYLHHHFSSLSDEALLAVDRADLTEVAQTYYDAEVTRRGLAPLGSARRADGPPAFPIQPDNPSDLDARGETPDTGEAPEWLDGAGEVYSAVVLKGRHEEERVADARQVLEAAGIPCYLELVELTPEEKAPLVGTHRWRLMVPGKLEWRATSILERDISNADLEAGWKMLLGECSDNELTAMHPEIVFCGLFDRIERVTKAYEEEIAGRRLKVESP